MDKKDLESLLKHHDDLYYNQDSPELSDAEYDLLKNQYTELYGEYNYVPGNASSDSKKYKHTTNVSSLDKVQITDKEKLKSEIERLSLSEDGVCVEPKFDGITIVIYPNGKFVTRGNGTIGEDVTNNCRAMPCFKNFTTEHTLRAEIIMPISNFNSINERRIKEGLEPFKNPRNAAAGMIRQKDSSKVEGLTAYIYEDIDAKGTHTEVLDDLIAKYGEMVTPVRFFDDVELAYSYIKEFDRSSLDYEIDGLVVKSDVANAREYFGETSHHPKSAIAVKFESQGIWTKINNIVWQVGRTGK